MAENSGGAHCLAYGVTTNHVLALEALVTAGGPARAPGRLTPDGAPDAPGYDLMGLLVGSEGDAGGGHRGDGAPADPRRVHRHRAGHLRSARAASETVSAIIAGGIIPAALEMVDGMSPGRWSRACTSASPWTPGRCC